MSLLITRKHVCKDGGGGGHPPTMCYSTHMCIVAQPQFATLIKGARTPAH
jgi:hypothetical protein